MQLQQALGNRGTARYLAQQRPVMQRLIAEPNSNSLYVSPSWANAVNVDGVKVEAALDPDKAHFKDGVKARVAEAYGIDGWSTIETNKAGMAARFRESVDDPKHLPAYVQLELLKSLWVQQNPGKSAGQAETFLNKMSTATHDRRNTALKNLGIDWSSHEDVVKKLVDLDFYLLDWDNAKLRADADEWFQAMVSRAKPVLLPSDYLEDDSDSDVDFDLDEGGKISDDKKTKVCVLISMVYQKSASAGTPLLAKQQMSGLMKTFGIDVPAGQIETLISSGKHLPKNPSLYDKLVNQLHEALHDDGKLYDLDRFSEKVFQQAGYKRIVTCNSTFANLPAAIPESVTLHAGQTYIFTVQGHALAMSMKQDVDGKLGTGAAVPLGNPSDYFLPLNETSKNYNLDALSKNVSSIWQE